LFLGGAAGHKGEGTALKEGVLQVMPLATATPRVGGTATPPGGSSPEVDAANREDRCSVAGVVDPLGRDARVAPGAVSGEQSAPFAWEVRWGGAGFDEIKADFRRCFPRHRDAVYLPEQKAWSVPREHMRRLEAWLALWLDEDAIAWERPSPPPTRATAAAPLAPAYAALCLTEAAPAELVEAAHHILAKRHHPDHGGDHETMVTINHAIDVIRAHQQ